MIIQQTTGSKDFEPLLEGAIPTKPVKLLIQFSKHTCNEQDIEYLLNKDFATDLDVYRPIFVSGIVSANSVKTILTKYKHKLLCVMIMDGDNVVYKKATTKIAWNLLMAYLQTQPKTYAK